MRKMRKEVCKTCEKTYEIENWRKKSSFCSVECRNQKASTWLLKTSFQIEKATNEEKLKRLKENFEKHVIRKEGCWEWSGRNHRGYPVMTCRIGLGTNRGHRASYLIHKGEIPEGKFILHLCHNRICTNPDHLVIGTHKDNMRDMTHAERQAKGSRVGTSKLNEEQVKEIKRELNKGSLQFEIAKKFAVSKSLIGRIKNEQNWKHVEV